MTNKKLAKTTCICSLTNMTPRCKLCTHAATHQSNRIKHLYNKITGLVIFLFLVLTWYHRIFAISTLQYCIVQEKRQDNVLWGRLKLCHWKSSKTGLLFYSSTDKYPWWQFLGTAIKMGVESKAEINNRKLRNRSCALCLSSTFVYIKIGETLWQKDGSRQIVFGQQGF